MENQPIKDPNDLYEALLELLVRAREGGLPAEFTQILFKTVEQVTSSSRKEPAATIPGKSNRTDFRLVANIRGVMIHAGERIPVVIHDISPHGFGVYSSVTIRPNTTLMLEAPSSSSGGVDVFSCFVSYSRKSDRGFLVGLRIIDMLPCL